MNRKPRVGIVGAGLAAANALLARGFDIRVYEQAPRLAEIGAGIQISPNAVKVFRALGLEHPLLAIAHEPEGFMGSDWRSGRVLFQSPIHGVFPEKYGASYHLVHRADLHQILAARCTRIEDRGDRVVPGFADGGAEEFDYVVGADGIRSMVREALFGPLRPRFTGCMCWRGLIPTERLPAGHVKPVSHVWLGPDGHIVHYHVRGQAFVNFVAVHETRDWVEESWTLPSTREAPHAGYPG